MQIIPFRTPGLGDQTYLFEHEGKGILVDPQRDIGRFLDEAAAQEAKRRAEDALANQAADIDMAKAQVELAEAVAQLRAIERLRKTR